MSVNSVFCWLTNQFENEDLTWTNNFIIDLESMRQFRIFYNAVFPDIKLQNIEFLKKTNNYGKIKEENMEIFNFNVLQPNKSVKLQFRLNQDLTRTLRKSRTDMGIPKISEKNDEIVLNWFSEMLVFIDYQGITYKQGYCDLLIPIFHIFFSGLLAYYSFSELSDIGYILEVAKAISSYGFMGLMKSSLNHIDMFPERMGVTKYIRSLTYQLNTLKEFKSISEKDVQLFASTWILLIFTQSLTFRDTISLWSELFKKPETLHEDLMKWCYCAAVLISQKAGDSLGKNFIQTMQKSQLLSFKEMLDLQPTLTVAFPKVY